MLKVGITGGIGSGKTTICKIFELLGIPIYYADEKAKWLMSNDPQLIIGIQSIFGKDAYLENGQLNRSHIASIAFNQPKKLSKLNALVHPAVAKDGEAWHNEQINVPYTLKEAALIFESGSYQYLDKTITVFAPLETRIQRVMKRDQSERAAIEARISKQMPDNEKMKMADFIIRNDGKSSLIQQVMQIHQQLLSLSATPSNL